MEPKDSSEAPLRTSEDAAGEGMWRLAAGERSPECWDKVPEEQKRWWRDCALRAVKDWLGRYRCDERQQAEVRMTPEEKQRIARLEERVAVLERRMDEHIEAAKREAEKRRVEQLAMRHGFGELELG